MARFRGGLGAAVAAVTLVLAGGCGGSDSPQTTRPPDTAPLLMGRDLLEARVVGANPGCVTCHSFDQDVTLVGPSLVGLGGRAEERVPALTAEEYLRQSIVEPDAFVVPEFSEGQMVGGWEELLTPEQIDSLVRALLEL